MQDIINYSAIDLDDATELAATSQSCNEHENQSATLYKLADGRPVYAEDMMTETRYYELEGEEIEEATADPAAWVEEMVRDWAYNCDESRYARTTELIAWDLASADDYEVADDYEGECVILCVANFAGYAPVSIVSDDDNEPTTFPSRAAAQEWIDAEEGETYQLAHGEMGRPAYTIIEA